MSRKKKQEVEILKDIDYESVKKESEKPNCFDGKQPFCKKELCQEYFDDCKFANSDELF